MCVERKLDGSSLNFVRGVVGLRTLGADTMSVTVVVERASVLRLVLR